MPFLSQMIGRTVADVDGESIGMLNDLLAASHGDLPHPQVVAIVVKRRGQSFTIPLPDVTVLFAPSISLNKRENEINPFQPGPSDLYLVRDVLDKQIIDTNGVRVVRVNDLEITRINDNYYVANVDIGSAGLLRRLGFGSLSRRLATLSKSTPGTGAISWDDVELLAADQPMRLKVSSDKLADLHPADLAEILSDLSRSESSQLLEGLDVETLAETLEEVEPEFQASLVEQMSNDKVADVLEEMSPDEAADLLAELSEERSEQLLNLMESEEAQDVRELLAYPEDAAGGIMNTEFIAVRPEWTAEGTMAFLRQEANEAETIYYIYVTDQDEHLLGVFSLRNLVLANPHTAVKEFMTDRVVTVELMESQEHCAQVISKYSLLAVPVVDEENKMHGIVTADDALDKIIPTAWKKRLPRLYH